MQSTAAYHSEEPSLSDYLHNLDNELSGFFASSNQWLIAEGVNKTFSERATLDDSAALDEKLHHHLHQQSTKHGAPALAIGALPFDDQHIAHFIIPERLHSLTRETTANNATVIPKLVQRREVPEPAHFLESVEKALTRIAESDLLKVVLSRTLELEFEQKINLPALIERLAAHNRCGFTYALNLDNSKQDERYFIGASPELLVSRDGLHVVANPLAGSRPLSQDAAVNRERAAELSSSEKDLHEHALVADAVADALRPFCRAIAVPSGPSLVYTDSMMHLSTRVVGTLREPYPSVLELVKALHPTPAVCGVPRADAHQTILELEAFERELFTGAVGWVDAEGNGEWAVTIRCAEVGGNALRLFAGAGVVAGSSPHHELAETGAKFGTMLRALGLPPLQEVLA
ncbi:isochorismate synthase [Candidatus Albibeggiatoa sp. nov. NOAA]|uniref:isochorismate synthase n=1 Tax=Candidatus Albibeggiatoa sp. nov. NOAA TaxID=3162724 RepID=UPI0032FC802F|nr:isochorismate synthase [Thiotrichaceae bacterium]